jgi:hypothetical protein
MNTQIFFRLVCCVAIIILGCNKDDSVSRLTQSKNDALTSKATQTTQKQEKSTGATQISGVSRYATTDECNAVEGFTFSLRLTGDLVGCLYTFVDKFDCSPSGTYREEGREYFVGTYNGQSGTFWTDYAFEGKYEGCPLDGEPLGAEIFGRCQHPIIDGSGTGGFEGVSGRLAFKDNVELQIFPYTGHLRF